MRLTPRETDKLMLHLAGELAKERRDRGVKLNYPEAIALISSEVMEQAREGMTVAELMAYGRTVVTADEVMPGVAEMIHEVEVEATFPDGTKLVSIHDPVETTEELVPGEYLPADGELTLNEGCEAIEIDVTNLIAEPLMASILILPLARPYVLNLVNRIVCSLLILAAPARSMDSPNWWKDAWTTQSCVKRHSPKRAKSIFWEWMMATTRRLHDENDYTT